MGNETQQQRELESVKNGEFICRGSQISMSKDIGAHGNFFGGKLSSTMDEAAAVFAAEICDSPMMVTKILNIEYILPVKVDKIIKTYCKLISIGRTSIKIDIELRKYSVHTELEQVVCKANSVFVKVDDEGNAIPISDRIRTKFNITK